MSKIEHLCHYYNISEFRATNLVRAHPQLEAEEIAEQYGLDEILNEEA